MPCQCATDITRAIVQVVGVPPAAPIQRDIKVTVTSRCYEFELPGEDDGGSDEGGKPAMKKSRAKKPGVAPEKAVARLAAVPGQKLCMNEVTVLLQPGTTAGLQISEVTLGTDVFACAIAVGATGQWVEATDPGECGPKPASVKITTAAGAFVANIGGFQACRHLR